MLYPPPPHHHQHQDPHHKCLIKNHQSFVCQRKRVRRNNAHCWYTFSGGMGRCPPPGGHFDYVYNEDHDEDGLFLSDFLIRNMCLLKIGKLDISH